MTRLPLGPPAMAVALAVVLVGCSSPELQTTRVDVDRAFAASRDPWAAPATVVFPSQLYGGASVLRDAGSRATRYPGLTSRRVARLEVRAAQSHGWSLASVDCADEGELTLALTKGEGLDDAVLAVVEVRRREASVALQVPHHLDGSWPSTTPLALEETCLAGGPVDQPPTSPRFDPYPGDGAEPSLEDFEPWQRDELSDDEIALREAVMADPFVASLGVDLLDVTLRTGDNWRRAGSESATLAGRGATPRGSVAAAVEQMSGWDVTWASCGAGLPASASLMREVDGTVVTARLTSHSPDEVSVLLGVPIPEAPDLDGYVQDTTVLTGSRCLSEKTPDAALGAGLVLEGTPVALPGSLHPYRGE